MGWCRGDDLPAAPWKVKADCELSISPDLALQDASKDPCPVLQQRVHARICQASAPASSCERGVQESRTGRLMIATRTDCLTDIRTESDNKDNTCKSGFF